MLFMLKSLLKQSSTQSKGILKMKKWFYVGLLFLTYNIPLHAHSSSFEIKFPTHEDQRPWKKVCDGKDQLIEFAEYVLESETKEKWTELVTTQYFVSRYDFPLESLFDSAIKELAKNHPQNKIDSRIVKSSNNKLIGEWWIKEKCPHSQHEYVEIFKEDNHVGILRYTTKKLNSPYEKIWQSILAKASFEPRL